LGVEDLDVLDTDEQVKRCVECKARIVSADETEGRGRVILNYGHTLAHALEASGLAGEPDSGETPAGETPAGEQDGRRLLRHGEAVAIGLVFAARLARDLGRIGDERVRRHEEIVAGYELPGSLPSDADPEWLVELMGRDKKAHGDLTFVLDGPRGVEKVTGVERQQVLAVLEGLGD
jgi:5-deoxy-5-amino-3-dehydroquinate synthase